MCGIAGFWQLRHGAETAAEILARMGAALRHRGPDDWGQWSQDAMGVGLVHRRLAIVDLSPAGRQPMTSSSGRFTLAFNGEIYNFEEIRRELGRDLAWRGRSDTEVMLEAIERWGLDAALGRFVGMFAFALWDALECRLCLVRDRLGIKPLYYGRVEGDFVFASELKAICQYPGFEATVDRDALALYMRHNHVPSPHCIYRGLRKLPPGCILGLDASASAPEIRRYWSAAAVAREGSAARAEGQGGENGDPERDRESGRESDREMIDELEGLLRRAVSLRMVADVPLGAFLSGGIDSSTVVALMQAESRRPVRTFTIGFYEEEYNEAAHARRIAAHLGTEHTELYLTPGDAIEVVPLLPAMFDEPFADSSQIPAFLVSKLARQSVTVSLSGDGGDELFGGYNRYLLTRRIWNGLKRAPQPLRRLASRLILHFTPQSIDGFCRVLRPFLAPGRRPSAVGDKAHKFASLFKFEGPQSIYMQALSHWDNPTQVVPGAREPDTVARFLEEAMSLPSIEEAMMLTDLAHYLPDDILTKVDRASMAVGLEARVPMLDHKVVEFAWRLPLHCKIRHGAGKWILRQLLYRHVPASLVERPKMGFGVPIAAWLRGPLREWAEDMLSIDALASHGFFEATIIRQRWQEHLSGNRCWQYQLWNVLVFQDWFFHQVSRRPVAYEAPFA